jgi:hypothetical protein
MESAESVPTVVISLAFCSSMKETSETTDTKGDAIVERRVGFAMWGCGCFYTNFAAKPESMELVPRSQSLSLPDTDEDARWKVETE